LQIKSVIEKEPLWQQKYQMPAVEYRGPALAPLRSVTPAPLKPLTVDIDPDAAASTTMIHFTLGNVQIASQYWYPPQPNHTTIQLAPHRYRLHAQTSVGTVNPSLRLVDVRLIANVTVEVTPSGQTVGPRLPAVPNAGPVISTVSIVPISNSQSGAVSTGRLKAFPLELETAIECEALQPPYTKWVLYGQLDQEVPQGAYRIRLRLGSDVFNETEVFVAGGEEASVRPTSAVSPLVEEALGVREEVPTDQVISESIGPIQAAVLPTMLPLIGAKAFDFDNVILSQFTGLVGRVLSGHRSLAVVVAVDGRAWPEQVSPVDILRNVRVGIESSAGELAPLSLEPLSRGTLLGREPNGPGLERVGLALAPAPDYGFRVAIESPHFGRLRVAAVALDRQVTIISLILRPDGSLDLSQNNPPPTRG
jgi:hypothetical protein